MSKLYRESHGRVGQATECYEYRILTPKIVVQRCGDHWFLGITQTDGTWHVAAYFATAEEARDMARRLAKSFAKQLPQSPSEAVRRTLCLVEHLEART